MDNIIERETQRTTDTRLSNSSSSRTRSRSSSHSEYTSQRPCNGVLYSFKYDCDSLTHLDVRYGLIDVNSMFSGRTASMANADVPSHSRRFGTTWSKSFDNSCTTASKSKSIYKHTCHFSGVAYLWSTFKIS